MKKVIVSVFVICLLLPLTFGGEFGYDSNSISIQSSTPNVINYNYYNQTLGYSNASDYWDGLDSPSDISGSQYWYNMSVPFINWLTTFYYNYNQSDGSYNASYVLNTGGVIGGDLNITGNASFSGRVGIGTSTPSKTLDVDGDISLEAGSGDYYSNDGSQGWTGSCINASYKNGLVVGCND